MKHTDILPTAIARPSEQDLMHSAWLANLIKLATKRARDLPFSTLQIANLQALSYLYDSELLRANPPGGSRRDLQDQRTVRTNTEFEGLKFINLVLTSSLVSEEIKEEFRQASLFRSKNPPHFTTLPPARVRGNLNTSVAVVEA